MKKIKIIGGILVIYLILMGVGFYGGMLYQQKSGVGQSNNAPIFQGTPPSGGVMPGQAGMADPGGGTTPAPAIADEAAGSPNRSSRRRRRRSMP